jgi:hypothetical protein
MVTAAGGWRPPAWRPACHGCSPHWWAPARTSTRCSPTTSTVGVMMVTTRPVFWPLVLAAVPLPCVSFAGPPVGGWGAGSFFRAANHDFKAPGTRPREGNTAPHLVGVSCPLCPLQNSACPLRCRGLISSMVTRGYVSFSVCPLCPLQIEAGTRRKAAIYRKKTPKSGGLGALDAIPGDHHAQRPDLDRWRDAGHGGTTGPSWWASLQPADLVGTGAPGRDQAHRWGRICTRRSPRPRPQGLTLATPARCPAWRCTGYGCTTRGGGLPVWPSRKPIAPFFHRCAGFRIFFVCDSVREIGGGGVKSLEVQVWKPIAPFFFHVRRFGGRGVPPESGRP